MKPSRTTSCAAVLAVLLGTVACSHRAPTPAAPSPSVTTSAPSPPASAPPLVAPLTGRPVHAVAQRPALTVKIENSTAARPQSGLDQADLVVEELVEGGITRFAAMFQTADPGTVGPVRSVRNVDTSIASPTRGLLAFSGGAGVVLKVVRKAPLQLLSGGAGFRRSGARSAPHNLYAKAGTLWGRANAAHRAPPKPYLPWAPDATRAGTATAPGNQAASQAQLTFSSGERPRWTYQASTRTWLRSEGSKPAKVASGRRLAADNVLVLRVRTRDAGYRDPAGNDVPESVLTGSGRLTVLSAGRQVSGTWHKAGRDARFTFTDTAGRPLLVAPGRTWIELVPSTGAVRIS
ncbi:DUF3048 domain-containing protein [Angustibacter luteus]|uniref:DUF3048 domain-containing protein n=1 Tax=Angustibacter luteus TaxID=658456 RepID=A0ABW1JEN0_9ACTN